jgi:phosphate transport system protein
MERHFHEQLQDLKETLIKMASEVESAIAKSIRCLIDRSLQQAEEIISGDERINNLEMQIDDQCLKLLALQQPMAGDLRFLTSAMKINSDLERMGDHAVNIAEQAKALIAQEPLKPLVDIPRMAQIAQAMVKDSLDSFIHGDIEKARQVCITDDQVDQLDDQLLRELLTYMLNDTKTISRALNLILVSKNLERVADLSTNIAEEVIFIYEAHSIKHHIEQRQVKDSRTRS